MGYTGPQNGNPPEYPKRDRRWAIAIVAIMCGVCGLIAIIAAYSR